MATLYFLLEQFYKNNEAQKRQKTNNTGTTLNLEWAVFKQINGQKGIKPRMTQIWPKKRTV